VAFSPDGQLLATGDSDTRQIAVWDSKKGTRLATWGTNSVGVNWSAQFSPDGRYFATAGGDGDSQEQIEVWAFQRNALSNSLPALQVGLFTRLPTNAWSLTFAPNSRRLAFVDNPGEPFISMLGRYRLYIWDFETSGAPRVITTNLIATVQSACFTPDSERLLYVSSSRDVVSIDVPTGREVFRFPTLAQGHIRTWTDFPNIALSPDGTTLAMVSASGLGVDLWDPKNGRLMLTTPDEDGTVSWLAWSPDSQRLAVARTDGSVAVWNPVEIEKNLTKLGLGIQR
jgi:WD40 repeat protein